MTDRVFAAAIAGMCALEIAFFFSLTQLAETGLASV